MKIALDVSPLESSRGILHQVRGSGFYIKHLQKSLLKYRPENQYFFFTKKNEIPVDISLIHYPYFEPFFLTLPFRKKCKTVVTVHDLIPLVFPKHFPPGLRGIIKWQVQKLALKRADAIITDSNTSTEDIARYTSIPGKKIHVVYLAAGEEFKKLEDGNCPPAGGARRLEIRKRYNLPEKFALYVGDVTWNKNLPRLIEAINKIDISLVMVGKALVEKETDIKNPWNKDLIKVQKLVKNNKQITCLGFVSQVDLVMLYNLATVLVMPSLYEGFGLPILEAMSCGCPVITGKSGSIPEIAEEAAFYVNPHSVEDIAKGIKKVFSSRELQVELSGKGLLQAKKFSWEKTAGETTRVFQDL